MRAPRVLDTAHGELVPPSQGIWCGWTGHAGAHVAMTGTPRVRHVGACADVDADVDCHVCSTVTTALEPMETANGGVSPAVSGTSR